MKIITGKILSAHGIKGEVKVKPMTDNPHRFRRGNSLYIEKDDAFALITAVREANGGILIVKFKGIDDRNHAERLKSSFLQIEEEDAAPLPEGSYYLFQLQGMTVFEEDGNRLGVIADIIHKITCQGKLLYTFYHGFFPMSREKQNLFPEKEKTLLKIFSLIFDFYMILLK